MRTRTIPPLLAALLGVTAVTACSDGEAGPEIDAAAYYEQYRPGESDVLAGAPTGVPGGAAGPDHATAAHEAAPAPPEWPGPTEDNVFVDAGDSTFVSTRDDAESTFALDVDTGSFHVGRALLTEGALPDPASIRVEEWVNAFRYGDPPPPDGDDLGAVVESGPAFGATDGTRLVRVGITTRELAERPPAALTFVVDTSGSMDIRERLGLVKASLALLVEHLDDDDTIAIVTYGDDAAPLLGPTPVSDAATIIDAIESLSPGGSTNLEAGLQLGYRQARRAFRPDAVNAVILASDGVANVGVTDPDVLTQQITQAGEEGIHLVTVGYGMGNYNDHLMEQLADQGDGFYRYIDTFEQAQALFVDELTPTLSVVAEEAKAQVVFDPDVVEAYRLIGYENRLLAAEDFNDDTKDAGELGAGHSVTALYEIVPVGAKSSAKIRGVDPLRYQTPRTVTPAARGGELAFVKLRYKAPDGDTSKLLEHPVKDDVAASPSADFRFAAAVAAFGMVLRESEHRGNATIDQVIALAREGLGKDREGYRAEFIRLAEKVKAMGMLAAGQ